MTQYYFEQRFDDLIKISPDKDECGIFKRNTGSVVDTLCYIRRKLIPSRFVRGDGTMYQCQHSISFMEFSLRVFGDTHYANYVSITKGIGMTQRHWKSCDSREIPAEVFDKIMQWKYGY